jgi:hypothetical protein
MLLVLDSGRMLEGDGFIQRFTTGQFFKLL